MKTRIIALSFLATCHVVVACAPEDTATNQSQTDSVADRDASTLGEASVVVVGDLKISRSDKVAVGSVILGSVPQCEKPIPVEYAIDFIAAKISKREGTYSCDAGMPKATVASTQEKVLESAEVESFFALASGVTLVADQDACPGFDGLSVWMTVTRKDGTVDRYTDGINCYKPIVKGHEFLLKALEKKF